ncbi:MAG: 2-oxo acid dehydrogenase subunit E2 [Planctomycetota bacterium]|jgi:pyruvate dehydrogenase E2 component (dihydrolipoamide acetyltransferase)
MDILKYPEKGRFPLEGVVIEWKKKQHDSVQKGEILLQIEAAGQTLEVESTSEGTLLKPLAAVGCPVKAGDSLAIIGDKGQDASKAIEQINQKAPSPAAKTSAVQAKPKAQPVAAQPKQTEEKKDQAMTTQTPAGNPENVIPILMPQAGQSMEEGTILSWKIKPGDTIEVGQVIMEIETDKATMEVEAPDAGRVARIIAAEGDIIEVKKPVAFIAADDADVDAYLGGAPAAAPAPAAPAPTAPAPAPAAASTPAPAAPSAPAQPAVSVPEGAVVPVLMPQAGQSMEEGTILAWKVAEGDQIEVGQIIMEIETDKATMEVEAVDAGRIAKIVAAEGDIIEVKQPVAYLAEADVDIDAYVGGGSTAAPAAAQPAAPAAAAAPAKKAPAVQKAAAQVSETGRVKASPAARKAAQQKGIDLSSVPTGSGPGGRILSTDVEQADVIPTEVQIYPLTKMRRAIANNLLYSKQNVPHFYAKKTIDAALLFATYRKTKEQFKCSVNDFVTKACAKAIRQYPAFRSQYKDTEVHENPAVNIGIAVGTDEGLTVPVVLNADRQNLEQLAAQTRQVVESARNGKLENFGHGIFTITNLGMFGCEEFSAIINPPESAILAVGAIREGVIVENGAMRPTRLMTMTLSVDHRVVDGVLAAQFLNTVQELLEDPEQLVG